MKRKTIAALILGILSLITWRIPLFGLPISIIGLILSIKSIKNDKKIAITALICSGIGLVLSLTTATVMFMIILSTNFNPTL